MGRIKAIIVKEFYHILRDPRSLTMVFITPLVMIFILGYSVSYDLNRIDAAVIDLAQSRLSRELVKAFAANRVFVVRTRAGDTGGTLSLAAAEELLRRRDHQGDHRHPGRFLAPPGRPRAERHRHGHRRQRHQCRQPGLPVQ